MAAGFDTVVLILALFTDTIFAECSVGCTSCSDSICSSCESSYYLSGGTCSLCSVDCNSCNGDGYDDCTSCKPNKWGLNSLCLNNCDNNCLNGECQDASGHCVQCKSGLYGLQCQHNCSHCVDGLCNISRCTQGCKQGYYEYNTGSESICQNCPQDCKYCIDLNTCYACNDGFYLFQFNSNGKIYVHCILCSLGSSCSNYCAIQNCNQCQISNDSLVCTDCPEGQRFNGVTCIQDTISCSPECSSYCDDVGICLGSCNSGWAGERCSKKCSDKCLTCEKSDGNICLQCKGDYYTTDCNIVCKSTCKIDEGKQTCRLTDGYCLNGCANKYWGYDCDQSCSNGCVDTGTSPLCERSNGTCKHRCKDGYSGDRCDIVVTRRTTVVSEVKRTTQEQISTQFECEENGGCKSSFLEGYFSGLGTSVVVAVIAATLFIFRRRYIAKKLKSHQMSRQTIEMPTYYNEDAGPTNEPQEKANETNNYESLSDTKNADNVYNDLEAEPVQQSASYYNMRVVT